MTVTARHDPLGAEVADLGDQVEVSVVVEEPHIVLFSIGGDQQIGHGDAVMAFGSESPLKLNGALL